MVPFENGALFGIGVLAEWHVGQEEKKSLLLLSELKQQGPPYAIFWFLMFENFSSSMYFTIFWRWTKFLFFWNLDYSS